MLLDPGARKFDTEDEQTACLPGPIESKSRLVES
jgi:hypothetical protein